MATVRQAKGFYQFGPYRLDPVERRLLRDGRPVPLTPKAFEILLILVENSGHLEEKNALMRKLWPDSFVEEANLAQHIFSLRKALGDGEEGARYIETVPKHGYRFIAPVTGVAESSAQTAEMNASGILPVARTFHRPWPIAAVVFASAVLLTSLWGWQRFVHTVRTPDGKIKLAVLPFLNLSDDPRQEYFSDGLTEEMISQLGRLDPERFGVIAPTSAMKYKGTRKGADEIGRELRVNYILEGSVRREGSRVRINAHLTVVSDQTQIWTQEYEQDVREILPLQREIAVDILRAVHLTLTPEARSRQLVFRSTQPEAYEAYLKGRHFWNKRTKEGREGAVKLFREAILLAPDFAPAHAGLAETFAWSGWRERQSEGQAAADRALELDSTSSEAHVAAGALAWLRFDWAAAERLFRRAVELDPSSPDAHLFLGSYLKSGGRFEDALAEVLEASELDPLSALARNEMGAIYYYARQYDRAIEELQKALELDPGHTWSRIRVAQSYAFKGMHAEAAAQFNVARLTSPGAADHRQAHAFALAGNRAEARKLLRRVLNSHAERNAVDVAAAYIALGQKELAYKWLETAIQSFENDVKFLKVDPRFDPLRSDRHFHELLRRIGLLP
ncbi:MAG: tetratricopeptide repeat protein [Acidobacteria bacterium]|nr:tetratricopeptide repeat protein [Acidobacteriota bacterium]